MKKKIALLSLSNLENLEPLVKVLVDYQYQLVATTSTAQAIKDLGYSTLLVEDITHFPEMIGGRIKTLHPNIHAAILADLDDSSHKNEIEQYDISPISIVVCNLYPFKEVLEEELNKFTPNSAKNIIENIDIGGITLLRSAAKNHSHVVCLSSPNQYSEFIANLTNDLITLEYKQKLAFDAFSLCATYDIEIANYFALTTASSQQLFLSAKLHSKLNYGENPDQTASLYYNNTLEPYSLASSKLYNNKQLSYNNILDIDNAFQAIQEFDIPCVIALKHNTPCGIGYASNIYDAYTNCFNVDPISIFGGILILNRPVDSNLARDISKTFFEVVIAPKFLENAITILEGRKKLRIVEAKFKENSPTKTSIRSISGGFLVQNNSISKLELTVVSKNKDIILYKEQMILLYKSIKHVKSNAIIIGQSNIILGISGGMVSRIDACKHAITKAINNPQFNSSLPLYLASDGFFPFNDIIDLALSYNIKYIITPNGSKNDSNLIEACNKHDISLAFTNLRYFKH